MHRVNIVIVNNRRATIHGLRKRALSIVDEALAMEIPGAQYQRAVRMGFSDGKRHLFSKKRLSFPLGLLSRVENLCSDLGYRIKCKDQRKNKLARPDMSKCTRTMLKGDPERGEPLRIKLRKYQLKAVRRGLKRQRGIQWLATNAGKTEIMIAKIKVLMEHRCLVLVHKKALLDQTRERIARRLGTIEEHIGIIGDGKFDPKHITVATIQTLTRKMHPAKRRIVQKYLDSIKQLHIDEGHHSKATTWYKLINRIDAQYRFIYSGTPFGSGNGLMVEACVGPVIYRVKNKFLIEKGYSARPTIEILECDKPELPDGLTWQDVYKQGIVTNEHRNRKIAKKVRKFVKAGKKVMILVTQLWHGDLIGQQLQMYNVPYVFAHGKMPRSAQRHVVAQYESKHGPPVLIASPIFDEGVDMPGIQALVIADGGKSVRKVLQQVGRGLRRKKGENVLDVVDFADSNHSWLARHSQDRISIYEAEEFIFKNAA